MTHLINRQMMTALLIAGIATPSLVQAARLEVVSYQGVSQRSGSIDGAWIDHSGYDFSTGDDYGTVGNQMIATGDYALNYYANGYIKNGQDIQLSLSHDLTPVISTLLKSEVSVSQIASFRVIGDVGENGQNVKISFAGRFQANGDLWDHSIGYANTTLWISKGDIDLAAYGSDWQQSNERNEIVSFDFWAKSGDLLTLDAYLHSYIVSAGPVNYGSIQSTLSGRFTVTTVPEPGSYAMLLGGLGLIGVIARRRAKQRIGVGLHLPCPEVN